ncbi:hypothetical protein [Afipia felis]|uniref:hypothetical protein n=1 Tax=Afipia felis TaxID=1035 RepID=UPI0011C02449|nr:hypothetical protein [Afipia felis]
MTRLSIALQNSARRLQLRGAQYITRMKLAERLVDATAVIQWLHPASALMQIIHADHAIFEPSAASAVL